MEKFTMLSRAEMKNVLGGKGVHTDATCTAQCQSGTVSCTSGANGGCTASDGEGCRNFDGTQLRCADAS